MLRLDGSQGEGGGQILRSALALSLVTRRAFRLEKIRAGRKKPGLMHQHLAAVRAAADVGSASVEGAEIGSTELTFTPGEIAPGDYTFSIGTAGSTTLVLQTVLPALITAEAASTLVLEGGTHNAFAPPFDFLARSFLPLVNQMGPSVKAVLKRCGFFPVGGGRIEVCVEPVERLLGFELLERGSVERIRARILSARLPRHVAEREARVIERALGLAGDDIRIEQIASSPGPGNAVVLEVQSERLTEVFTAFGRRGVRAESVAEDAVEQVKAYVEAGAAVGPYLADQFMLPLALAGRGAFTTMRPTQHASTHIAIIHSFLEVPVAAAHLGGERWRIDVG